MSIRVLLVDDHKMMRDGLRALLSGANDIEVVGEASDGHAALQVAQTLLPDVVVMDVEMPGLDGIEATRRLRAEYDGMKVVALSTREERNLHGMLKAGANGYVLKTGPFEELLQALRAASRGRTYLSPEIAGLVAARSTSPHARSEVSGYSTLCAREREALRLVAQGRTSAETAKQMNISTKTVETHRRHIVEKLGLHGIAELTKYALREGLTSLDN
jgi:DNA-binding NarL/FixJ family response regulator